MKNLRIIQSSPLSSHCVYMLDNMFEESYVQEMLEHVKLLTEKDTINKTSNVKANMTDYRELLRHDIYKKLFFSAIEYLDLFTKMRNTLTTGYIYEVEDAWAMKHTKGDYTVLHNHNLWGWSGAFYLQISEETRMYFGDFLKEEFLKENTLYLFPSSVMHQVHEHRGDESRYSIAFNITQKTDEEVK